MGMIDERKSPQAIAALELLLEAGWNRSTVLNLIRKNIGWDVAADVIPERLWAMLDAHLRTGVDYDDGYRMHYYGTVPVEKWDSDKHMTPAPRNVNEWDEPEVSEYDIPTDDEGWDYDEDSEQFKHYREDYRLWEQGIEDWETFTGYICSFPPDSYC